MNTIYSLTVAACYFVKYDMKGVLKYIARNLNPSFFPTDYNRHDSKGFSAITYCDRRHNQWKKDSSLSFHLLFDR